MTSPNALAVLVVDDNRDGADTLAHLLGACGHEAHAAYSAREAGQTVRDGFVLDAVLLDLGLPDMDGFEVARELCAALPRRPLLVAVTGYGNLRERPRREGFQH
jgi:CheY-like chemotaxis protein